MKVIRDISEMENAFDLHAKEYDAWYEKHSGLYRSELAALGKVVPRGMTGVEIGAGTGRFSVPFGITIGVEPSVHMAKMAEERGVTMVKAVAEDLPFHDESFDFALMVTTVCFLDDIMKAFREAYRILKSGGCIILGIIDRNSPLGKQYEKRKSEDKFYSNAQFQSTEEITSLLAEAGFNEFQYWQTLIDPEGEHTEEPVAGYGQGSFVVTRAMKK